MLRRLPYNGGIVMVVALPGFLKRRSPSVVRPDATPNRRGKGRCFRDSRIWSKRRWRLGTKANPEPVTTVQHMADHIDHIREVAGVESIGIGGDFDGMPSGPVGFEDVRGYPELFAELARRGYSQAELEMIASRNALRVMRAAEAYAASVRTEPPIETLIASPGKAG